MSATPQTLAVYTAPWEAQVDLALLQSEGIPAFTVNEDQIRMNWAWSQALGGVRLQVPASCLEQAREVLARRDRGEYEQQLREQFAEEDIAADEPPASCPACGAHGSLYHPRSLAGIVLAFFTLWWSGVTFPVPKSDVLRCRRCGAEIGGVNRKD